jgi:hypothetical protein
MLKRPWEAERRREPAVHIPSRKSDRASAVREILYVLLIVGSIVAEIIKAVSPASQIKIEIRNPETLRVEVHR